MSSNRPSRFRTIFNRNRVAPVAESASNSSVEVIDETSPLVAQTDSILDNLEPEESKDQNRNEKMDMAVVSSSVSRHGTFLCVESPKALLLPRQPRVRPSHKKSLIVPKSYSKRISSTYVIENGNDGINNIPSNSSILRTKSLKEMQDLHTFNENSFGLLEGGIDLNQLIDDDDEELSSILEPDLYASFTEICNGPTISNSECSLLLDPIQPQEDLQGLNNCNLSVEASSNAEVIVGDILLPSFELSESCSAQITELPPSAEGETIHSNKKGLRFMKRFRVALRRSLTMFNMSSARAGDVSSSIPGINLPTVSERVRSTFATKYTAVRSMFKRKPMGDRPLFDDDEFWVNN